MTTGHSEARARPGEGVVFAGLLVLLFAAPLVITTYVPIDALKWFVIRIGGPVLFLAWAVVRIRRGERVVRWEPIGVLAAAFMGTQLLSMAGAINPWSAWTDISKHFALVCVFFLVANASASTSRRDAVMWTVALLGACTALYGIAQHWGYDFFPWVEDTEVPVSRGVSFMGHATFAGSVLILSILLTLGLATTRAAKAGKVLAAALAFLMLYHLSFSGARIASVSLACAALATVAAYFFGTDAAASLQRARMRAATVAVVCVAVLASAFIWSAWRVKDSDAFAIRQSSFALRLYAWETASRMFVENPVTGVGAGNYAVASPPYWNAVQANRFARHERAFQEVHNEYLEVAVEQGLPGLMVFLGITAFSITASFSLTRRAGPRDRLIGLALFGAVVAASVDASITFTHQNPSTALLYWVVLGLVVSETQRPEHA